MALNIPNLSFESGPLTDAMGVVNALNESRLKQRLAQLKGEQLQQQNALTKEMNPYKIQEAQFKAENPLMSSTGTAGQLGAAIYLNKLRQKQQQGQQQNPIDQLQNQGNVPNNNSINNLPFSDDYSNMIVNSLNSLERAREARMKKDQQMVEARGYTTLPPESKSQMLGQAAAFGIPADEASRRFVRGESLQDMAKEKGFDNPDYWPEPIYAPTATTRTQLQRRQTAISELNSVGKDITNALAPYQKRFMGYSLEQVADALKGQNKDKQARFLAGIAVQPELAAIRARAMGANIGIEVIREMVGKSMGQLKTIQPLLDTEVYEKMQIQMDKWMNQMADASFKANTQILARKNANEKETELTPTLRYNQATGDFEEIK